MPRDAAEMLRDAMDSLDTEVDEDAEEAWREEIRRRLQEIDSGATKLVPCDEARRRLLARRQ
jgi:putative addiction module component (TIGR02574 family)